MPYLFFLDAKQQPRSLKPIDCERFGPSQLVPLSKRGTFVGAFKIKIEG